MNVEALENNLKTLVSSLNKETFIYDLLMAYELPKASVTRLQKGDYNLSKVSGEILWKKKLFFKQETTNDLHQSIDNVSNNATIVKQHPRFIIVTDFEMLLAVDTKTADSLDILLTDLSKHYDFFLPWAGLEKTQFQSENPADVKAAERMGRLYDIILEDNPTQEKDQLHALNIFLSRLLFCFFAEDTGIFQDNQFTNAIASHTGKDGSDLQAYLQKLFAVLNVSDRTDYPQFLQDFPYVNGGLFADDYPLPSFTAKSRKIIIECGELNWKSINPDIFGSMIQAVVHNDQRSNLGMHYTSVTNIMKVIEPLFLNELYEALENAEEDEKKLSKLLGRLYNLRIFDPACGSGNFLIIAYKELCKLEMEIFRQLQSINKAWESKESGLCITRSGLQLSQFYGIEIDDFAHETAKLSLWLTEHQMNLVFKDVFGETRPTLPLQDAGNIFCGNATRLNWELVCPKLDLKGNPYEIYILGNPPYLGARIQDKQQKSDVKSVLGHINGFNNLDYISCWFLKASEYIRKTSNEFAFVSTNSISQGISVAMLWPSILVDNEISFAHQSFKWTNNAKGNAGVICVVIGIRSRSTKCKYIFRESRQLKVSHINAYLFNAGDIYIQNRRTPISSIPYINYGSFALDDGNLTISKSERELILKEDFSTRSFLYDFIGAKELIQGGERYCLWIDDVEVKEVMKIAILRNKIERVGEWRQNSDREATKKLSNVPHRFAEIRQPTSSYLAFPTVSSERREYIPIAFLEPNIIASNQIYIIANPDPYIFAVISSHMHMTWVRTVAGRLKSDYRYSSSLCYNTFPFPNINDEQKSILEQHVFKVLDEREQHSEKTMAQLYDPDKMPAGLRKAHHEMDLAIEQCYRPQPFKSDEERLEYLFKLYETMIAAEDND
ncbi:MAG: class I SAM-dependent DNA methyltransferase [Methylococcales bacterium]|nr:class I SAM-dependent DNA methyltransferase [Methylococcales bacterium]